MAADEMSEQNFQGDDIEEFQEDFAITSTPLAQNLSIVQSIVQTDEYSVEIFIDLVKEEPCLWNTSFRSYKDQTKKKNAWANIAGKMGKDIEFLKAQWKNLRENFKRCLDKRNRMTRSGVGARSLPSCRYFQNLLFLKDKVANKETESNVSLPNQSHADCLELEDSIIQNMGAVSQQQSTTPPNTRPGAEQNAPLLSTTAVGNSTQKQVPTTSSASAQQRNTIAPLAPTPDKRKSGSNALFSGTPKQKRAAREELSNTVDLLTLKYLDNCNSTEKELNQSIENFKEEDPDMLFLKSLHSSLTKLPKRKNRRARMKLQQVLFELEGSDDELSIT